MALDVNEQTGVVKLENLTTHSESKFYYVPSL